MCATRGLIGLVHADARDGGGVSRALDGPHFDAGALQAAHRGQPLCAVLEGAKQGAHHRCRGRTCTSKVGSRRMRFATRAVHPRAVPRRRDLGSAWFVRAAIQAPRLEPVTRHGCASPKPGASRYF